MDTVVNDIPNLSVETVPVKEASVGLDAIAQKMAAMRNQTQATIPAGTGSSDEAKAEAPVAPRGVEIQEEILDDDTNMIEPEVAEPETDRSGYRRAGQVREEGQKAAFRPEDRHDDRSTSRCSHRRRDRGRGGVLQLRH